MTDRAQMVSDFGTAHGADAKSLHMIAGDASNRKYYRATRNGRSVILMDAPPEMGENTEPFVRLAIYLRSIGLSAPEILKSDPKQGFLMIEDLGDDLFARLLEDDAVPEITLYAAATDLLLHLHQHPAPDVPTYDAELMADLAALSVDWYAPAGTDRVGLQTAMSSQLQTLDKTPRVLIQRDYHAENLIWLPDRAGVARVGLLDFQDGMLGHPAYDLVSVLQDARRDVPPEIENEMIARYLTGSALKLQDFRHAYHLLGLQRNLRIVGVFARLWLRDARPRYVDLIPRVWGYVTRNLDALNDADLSAVVLGALPAPTAKELDRIKGARA